MFLDAVHTFDDNTMFVFDDFKNPGPVNNHLVNFIFIGLEFKIPGLV